MPYGTKCGVYEADLDAGTEVSSTYEGRHLTFLASELACPTGTVVKGDPVVVTTARGDIVGVALKSQVAPSDLIAIDTEGIWNLSVDAIDDWGDVAVVAGDPLYINTTDGDCTISRKQDPAANTLFGYALGAISSGDTAVIAVKVHWGPSEPEILMGMVSPLSTAVTGRSAWKLFSDFAGATGYHVPVWVISELTTTGDGSIYGVRGHVAINTGVTANGVAGQYLVGVHGRFANQGIADGSNVMIAGILGQLLAGGVYTEVSRMFAIWGDSQLDKEVTAGQTAMLGLTNNGAHRFGAMVYMYGNSQASSGSADYIWRFDSLYFGGASGTPIRDGGNLDLDISTGGVWKKLRICVDGTEYWLVAMTNPTAH